MHNNMEYVPKVPSESTENGWDEGAQATNPAALADSRNGDSRRRVSGTGLYEPPPAEELVRKQLVHEKVTKVSIRCWSC